MRSTMSCNIDFSVRGKPRIPSLTRLLSKRIHQFAPDVQLTYFSKASGTKIPKLDGQCYSHLSISGIGANTLSYCDFDGDVAVIQCVRSGNSGSLNAPEEVELAVLLCNFHSQYVWAAEARVDPKCR